MGRTPCCAKEGLNKGPWTEMEDKTLIEYINTHGEGKWRNLPKKAGLKRCGKSCRLRWLNYLRPGIKRGNITPDEEELIIKLHKLLGNRWSLIAGRLPGRTDNEIKNYWNTNLGKRVNRLDNPRANNSSNCKQLKKPSNEKNKNQQTPMINVVRSKAIRCSKVVINNPLHPQPYPHPSGSNTDHTNKTDSSINNHSTVVEANIMSDDFNIGDLSLISELLNTEFTEVCDISYESSSNNNNNANDLSPNSLEQPFVFSQDMLEDWLSLEFNK